LRPPVSAQRPKRPRRVSGSDEPTGSGSSIVSGTSSAESSQRGVPAGSTAIWSNGGEEGWGSGSSSHDSSSTEASSPVLAAPAAGVSVLALDASSPADSS